MYERNNISDIEAACIPVALDKFECGCWGRHQPPDVVDGTIVIAVGRGYESKKHLHGQNVYVIEVDSNARVALIEMRKYGDTYGAGMWHYIIGIDDTPFVAQVSKNITDLSKALDSLKPAEVRHAETAKLNVLRQGDWYFVPISSEPRGKIERNVALAGSNHTATEAVVKKSVLYVRGDIRHPQHATVKLTCWHKAIRNNAIRTGRLARGLSAD